MLRSLHDTVLQTLEGLALTAAAGTRSAEERLREVSAIALQQASELRSALSEDTDRHQDSLAVQLRSLANEFLRQGLTVELLTSELAVEPPLPVTQALAGAAREALTNVAKHAGTDRVIIRAVTRRKEVQIAIRDHGRGFDPATTPTGYGVASSIIERLREVGGRAEIWSAPGQGTRVTLWAPT